MTIIGEWTEIVWVARSAHLSTLAFADSGNRKFVQEGLERAVSRSEICFVCV